MPRGHTADNPVTRMLYREGWFTDPRSFVSLPGEDNESHLFLYGPDWDRQRQRCFVRDEYKCQECRSGVEAWKIEPHHIIRKSKGGSDDLTNLRTLCGGQKGCHSRQHPEKRLRFSEPSVNFEVPA